MKRITLFTIEKSLKERPKLMNIQAYLAFLNQETLNFYAELFDENL